MQALRSTAAHLGCWGVRVERQTLNPLAELTVSPTVYGALASSFFRDTVSRLIQPPDSIPFPRSLIEPYVGLIYIVLLIHQSH